VCTGAVLASKPSAPVLWFNPSKGLNVRNPTTNGGRHGHGFGPRRPNSPVCCDECSTIHQSVHCPECGNPIDGAIVGTLTTEVTTRSGERWRVVAERDPASDGWIPVEREPVAAGEAFTETGTVWERQP
jgi:hypothetical protein